MVLVESNEDLVHDATTCKIDYGNLAIYSSPAPGGGGRRAAGGGRRAAGDEICHYKPNPCFYVSLHIQVTLKPRSSVEVTNLRGRGKREGSGRGCSRLTSPLPPRDHLESAERRLILPEKHTSSPLQR